MFDVQFEEYLWCCEFEMRKYRIQHILYYEFSPGETEIKNILSLQPFFDSRKIHQNNVDFLIIFRTRSHVSLPAGFIHLRADLSPFAFFILIPLVALMLVLSLLLVFHY